MVDRSSGEAEPTVNDMVVAIIAIGLLWISYCVGANLAHDETMIEKMKNWFGGAESDAQKNRHGAGKFYRHAQESAKLETRRDIGIFVSYVNRNKKDYDGNPAVFYWPELGLDFDHVENDMIGMSLRPENRDRRIYADAGLELWTVLNGKVTKREIVKEHA